MNVPRGQRVWRELFWDLFAPTEIVRKALAAEVMPERYAAIIGDKPFIRY